MADVFEELLAECLQVQIEEGSAGVEALLARHPAEAERLRSRLAQLDRLGLLGDAESSAHLGPYRLHGQLGAGGMGVVHLASDADGGEVALKLLPPSPDARTRERFAREAASIAALDHPGIVRVVDVGEAEGRPYLALELVHGATLAEVLSIVREDGRPVEDLTGSDLARAVATVAGEPVQGELFEGSWVEAMCRVGLAVAEALAHAHGSGVVHRDVKPSNVLLAIDGSVRLFDFGLAHLVDADSLTRTGDFAGTPSYTSPEQLSGLRDLDGRTDVFGLGATLYELLCLRRPFEGEGTAAVFRAIQTREPTALRSHNPEVSLPLESVCLTALAKERRHRYPGATEMAEDLRRFLSFRPVVARPIGPMRRLSRMARTHPGWTTSAGLLLVALITLPAALLWVNRTIRAERDRAEESARLSAAVVEYMVGLFEGAAEEDLSARGLLDEGVERLPFALEDDLVARAALFEASGRAYSLLGLPEEAIPLFDRAFALVKRERGSEIAEGGDSLEGLARAHVSAGDGRTAAALCRRRLAVLESSGESSGLRAAALTCVLGRALHVAGDPVGAREELEEGLGTLRRLKHSEGIAIALVDLARLDMEEGHLELAQRRAEEARALRVGLWSPSLASLREVLSLCAEAARALGEVERARDLEQRAGRLVRGSTEVGGPPFSYLPAWRPEYDRRFQGGISALQGERYEDARLEFEACLKLSPKEAVCAYNLACVMSRAGDQDSSLKHLEQAISWGFGSVGRRLETARTDPDLTRLRELAEWPALLARMEAELELSQAYAQTPGWIPAPTSAPLLVVLHGEGSTKDEIVEGPWGQLARECGYALLAPSAIYAAGAVPEEGMSWTYDLPGFARDPRRDAKPARDALGWLEEQQGPWAGPIVLAGEGVGGVLAFELCLRAPGRFAGAILRGAAPHPRSLGARARLAEAMQLPLEVILDGRSPLLGAPVDAALEETQELWTRWLSDSWRGPVRVAAPLDRPFSAALRDAVDGVLRR